MFKLNESNHFLISSRLQTCVSVYFNWQYELCVTGGAALCRTCRTASPHHYPSYPRLFFLVYDFSTNSPFTISPTVPKSTGIGFPLCSFFPGPPMYRGVPIHRLCSKPAHIHDGQHTSAVGTYRQRAGETGKSMICGNHYATSIPRLSATRR